MILNVDGVLEVFLLLKLFLFNAKRVVAKGSVHEGRTRWVTVVEGFVGQRD